MNDMLHLRGGAGITCRVLLEDIEVEADIGMLAAELGVPQPLRLHVALDVVPPSDDDLTQTFDYRDIHACVRTLAGQRIALIETFAMRLAAYCLAHPIVLAAEVRIDKPRAVPGCLAGTKVRIEKPWGAP